MKKFSVLLSLTFAGCTSWPDLSKLPPGKTDISVTTPWGHAEYHRDWPVSPVSK